MKRIITCMLIISAYSSITGQEENNQEFGFNKGDITISGAINYNKFKSNSQTIDTDVIHENDQKGSNFTIKPEFGYFINNNLMIGVKAKYKTSKRNNQDTFQERQSGYGTGVFGRYYLKPKKRISLFIELAGEYSKLDFKRNFLTSTRADRNSHGTSEILEIGFSPGINIFLNKRLSLISSIGNIGYTSSKTKSQYDDNSQFRNSQSSSLNASLGLENFYFGIQYRI